MEKVYMTFLCYFTNQQQKNEVVANTWEGATPLSLHCTQTFRANKLLLISAPSRRVCRSALDVSAPLSLPARSMRENFPCIFPFLRRMIWKTAWLRDEWALADVCPDVLSGGWSRWWWSSSSEGKKLITSGEGITSPKNMNIVLDDVCMTINEFQSFDLITDQIQEHKVLEFLRKFLLSYLQLFPTSMSFRTSSVHLTSFSCSPTTCTCCFPSSNTLSLALRFSRSNTYKHSSVSIK